MAAALAALAAGWDAEAARLHALAAASGGAPGTRGQSYAFAECSRDLRALIQPETKDGQ
jgi:hypothetical protein